MDAGELTVLALIVIALLLAGLFDQRARPIILMAAGGIIVFTALIIYAKIIWSLTPPLAALGG